MSIVRTTLATALLFTLTLGTPAAAKSKIEAVQGKRYNLRDVHGPWMIMVNSFRNVDEAERKAGGMTAQEAADETVFELRRRGIPAYTFLQKQQLAQLKSARSEDEGRYKARQEYIAVMAGNFPSQDDPAAKQVLTHIQTKFDPDFMHDPGNGAVFKKTPGRPTPFSRAFMAPNPLRSADDVRRASVSADVRKLNAGIEHSLLNNTGKYSLLVATFSLRSIIQVEHKVDASQMKKFDESLDSSLDESARKAWELTEALRQAKRLGYDRDFDSWVYHDKYKSYVSIGSFDSKDDPRIAQLKQGFGAKMKPNPQTGEQQLTPELFSIPKNPVTTTLPDKLWFFEMEPKLIPVPGK